jgi:nitroreductase
MAGRPYSLASIAVNVDEAIRTRRTHKAYGGDPVPRPTLDELFELARWAPNHHMTNPWRFRVLGPESLARRTGDPVQDEEDMLAGAVASYIVLLGAHARGLAGYWRTPEVLRRPAGRAAVGVGDDEHVLGLLHLGPPRQDKEAPGRLPPGEFVTYLS